MTRESSEGTEVTNGRLGERYDGCPFNLVLWVVREVSWEVRRRGLSSTWRNEPWVPGRSDENKEGVTDSSAGWSLVSTV